MPQFDDPVLEQQYQQWRASQEGSLDVAYEGYKKVHDPALVEDKEEQVITPEQKSFLQNVEDVVVGGFQTAAGGIGQAAQSIVESLPSFAKSMTIPAPPGSEEYAQEGDKKLDAVYSQDLSFTEKMFLQGVQSLSVAAPSIAAGVFTGSPAVALSPVVASSFGGSYHKGKEAGLDDSTAFLYAGIDAGIEAATEFLPAKFAVKEGLPFIKRLALMTGTDMAGESAAMVGQSLNEFATINKEGTIDEWADSVFSKDGIGLTLATTAVMSPLMAGTAQLAHNIKIAKAEKTDSYDGLITNTVDNVTERLVQENEFSDAQKVIQETPDLPEPYKYADKSLQEIDEVNSLENTPAVRIAKIRENISEAATAFKQSITRTFPELPNTAENAVLHEELVQQQKAFSISARQAENIQTYVLHELKPNEYTLYKAARLARDRMNDVESGRKLQDSLTPEIVKQEFDKVTAAVDAAPNVKKALEKNKAVWDSLRADYINAMYKVSPALGRKVKRAFHNEDYFRHDTIQVVDKLLSKEKKKSRRFAAAVPRDSSVIKHREGGFAYNTNVPVVDATVMTKMLTDIRTAEFLSKVQAREDKGKAVRKLAKDKGVSTDVAAKELGLEKYSMEKDGSLVFYKADAISSKKALSTILEEGEATIGKDDLYKVLAASEGKVMYVRPEVAKTLRTFNDPMARNEITRFNKKLMTGWKRWTLISPLKVAKYTFRNLTGDAEAVFLGNPKALVEVPSSVNDIYQYYLNVRGKKGDMVTETGGALKEMLDQGAIEGTLQGQEMTDLLKLRDFSNLYNKTITQKALNTANPMAAIRGVWKFSKMGNDARELVLRLANYKQFKADILKNKGEVSNYGASNPEIIDGLMTSEERIALRTLPEGSTAYNKVLNTVAIRKAYRLQNDLLGAYDDVTHAGRLMREQIAPFWSWQEVNAKRIYNLARNVHATGGPKAVTKLLGKRTALRSPYAVYRASVLYGKVLGLYTALAAVNHELHPEEEDTLPQYVKDSPHINFGQVDGPRGKVNRYFTQVGAAADFLDWVGLDNMGDTLYQVMSNKVSLRDAMKKMVDDPKKMVIHPLNKLYQLSVPLERAVVNTIRKEDDFPDALNPRKFDDRAKYIAKFLSVEPVYKALFSEEPTKKFKPTDLFFYESAADESVYYNVLNNKYKYLKKIGKDGHYEGTRSKKSEIAYHMRKARRLGDNEKVKEYVIKYFNDSSDGKFADLKDLKKEFKKLEPLYGLCKKEKVGFLLSLDKKEREEVIKAQKFYEKWLKL